MLRQLLRARVVYAAAAILSALTFTTVPADAASSTKTGLDLYSDPNFSRLVTSITYETCDDFIGTVPGRQVGSFDNRPPAGCEVVLHSTAGDVHLCAGRSQVAPTHRRVVLYTIRAGLTVPCRAPR